ncbi:putative amidase PB8B6.03 [Fusarium oxysporum f. sp. albedinis]|nr:putative amidase PB8B6.03 [Fusarium oxysporum f. sp. albedinis]
MRWNGPRPFNVMRCSATRGCVMYAHCSTTITAFRMLPSSHITFRFHINSMLTQMATQPILLNKHHQPFGTVEPIRTCRLNCLACPGTTIHRSAQTSGPQRLTPPFQNVTPALITARSRIR